MVELQIALERKIVDQIEKLQEEIEELKEENDLLRSEIDEYVAFIRGTSDFFDN